MQISRIRLSDKTSRLHPRHVVPKRSQADEPEVVIMAAVANEIERGNAVVIAGNSLAIDDAGARAQACQRLDDQWEAASEVVARTAIEAHSLAVLAGNDAEAVVLDLVQPLAAGRQLIGLSRKARRDEPGREGTLQHEESNTVG